MAAGKPVGKSPEKHGSDVKEEPKASEVQEDVVETRAHEEDVDLDDSDLENYSKEDQKIPYARFKDVNEKAKDFEQKYKDLESRYQSDLQRKLEDAEIRIMNRMKQEQKAAEEDSFLTPEEKQIRSLQEQIAGLEGKLGGVTTQLSETQLDTQLKALKIEYPDADDVAVMGWMKALPGSDVRQLMEKSHKDNRSRVEGELRKILKQKKEKAKQRIPSGPGRVQIRPDKPVTSLKDAGEAARRFFNR